MNPKYIALIAAGIASFGLVGCDENKSALEETQSTLDSAAEKVVDTTRAGLSAAGKGIEKGAKVTEEVVVGAADAIKEAVNDDE